MLPTRFTAGAQELLELESCGVEQRPDHVRALRRHGRQPGGARAARQAQQHRLSLIVARVRNGDAIRVDRCDRFLKKPLPRKPACHFERDAMLCRLGGNIDIADHRRHAQPIGERPAKRRVFVGRHAANPMMEVRESREHESVAGGDVAKQQDQRDRIRTSRHGCDDARAGSPQRIPLGISPHAIDQITRRGH